MSATKSHELKNLQSLRTKLAAELAAATEEKRSAQRKESMLQEQLREVEQRIAGFTTKQTVVTEHAMLRYMERVMGVDLDVIRGAILTPQVQAVVRSLPNGKVPIDGGRVVVKNGVIVTVEPV